MKKILLLIISILFFIGCQHQKATPKNIMDSAENHIKTALRLIDENKFNEAKIHILRAKELNPDNSMVYSTLYLITKNKNDLNKAKNLIKNKVDKYMCAIAGIRNANNESEIINFYNKIYQINLNNVANIYYDESALNYYTGKRFYELNKFKQADYYLSKVYNFKYNSKFKEKARKLWQKVNRIIRDLEILQWNKDAQKIITKDKVKRVDAAVLLADELNLNKLLKGFFKSYNNKEIMLPEDIIYHPNITQIKIFYKFNIRGLTNIINNGKIGFFPNKPLNRAEFAMAIEDIIAKLKNDKSYKTKFFGNKSPFVDVSKNAPYFNAVMNITSMGFLKANKYSEFRPNEPISGIDLIEAIIKIKEELEL